jgi:hypothetical protein
MMEPPDDSRMKQAVVVNKPENKYPRVPDILSGTNWLVPDTGHFVPDIKKLQ